MFKLCGREREMVLRKSFFPTCSICYVRFVSYFFTGYIYRCVGWSSFSSSSLTLPFIIWCSIVLLILNKESNMINIFNPMTC